MAVHHHGRRPGAVRDNRPDPEVHEGRRQTGRQQAHAGSRLKPLTSGKAPPDRPAFQPYWGKPAVQNERGDRGNVGIIRSPVRASILPDDGMRLALAAVPGSETEPAWSGGEVPAEHAIRGFHSVSLLLREAAPTGAILTDVFGFSEAGREGSTVRFKAAGTEVGGIVDIREAGDFARGRQGGGSVHHIAFRAADDAAAFAMMQKLAENHGIRTTDQKDRNYFRSLYFREPGGGLFEIATDIPGVAVDEPVASLGQSLRLPAQYEPKRKEIEAILPVLAA